MYDGPGEAGEAVIASFVPAMRTKVEPRDAVLGFRQAALRMWNTAKPETVAIIAAQSALETGRWASMWNNCVGNIKAGAQYRGYFTCFPLLNEVLERNGKRETVWFSDSAELVSKGGPPAPGKVVYPVPDGHPQSRFRAFVTFGDGASDKLAFLQRSDYAVARDAALAGDPAGYVRACRAAGYFTADLDPYVRGVTSLFKTFLPLAKSEEREPVALPRAEEDQLCRDMADCMRIEIPDWLKARVDALQIPYQDLIDFTDRST